MEKWMNMTLFFGSLSIATYAKLFIATVLPANINRILYIDSDTMIRGSLLPLWNENLGGKPVGAVAITMSTLQKHANLMDGKDMYVNSGVMLIDLKLWKRLNIEEKCVNFILFFEGKMNTPDERVVNGVLHDGYIKPIHPKYNYFFDNSFGRYSRNQRFVKQIYSKSIFTEADEDPVIIHFTGEKGIRPWIEGQNSKYHDEYMMYRNLSPWAVYALKKPPVESKYRKSIRSIIHSLPNPILFKYLDFQFFRAGIKSYRYYAKMLKISTIKSEDCVIHNNNDSNFR